MIYDLHGLLIIGLMLMQSCSIVEVQNNADESEPVQTTAHGTLKGLLFYYGHIADPKYNSRWELKLEQINTRSEYHAMDSLGVFSFNSIPAGSYLLHVADTTRQNINIEGQLHSVEKTIKIQIKADAITYLGITNRSSNFDTKHFIISKGDEDRTGAVEGNFNKDLYQESYDDWGADSHYPSMQLFHTTDFRKPLYLSHSNASGYFKIDEVPPGFYMCYGLYHNNRQTRRYFNLYVLPGKVSVFSNDFVSQGNSMWFWEPDQLNKVGSYKEWIPAFK